MARPITITDERILDAARAVFLKDGFNASTIEIARLAGVAEGTLFRRFATKEGLFQAALKPPAVPSWVRELDNLSGQGDMRDNLMRLVREIVRFAQERIPFAMLRWSHKPASSDSVSADEGASAVARDSRRLALFLQKEMDRGRLRPCRVDMVARLLMGPSLNLVLDSVVNKQPLTPEEIERFTTDLVETLWQGIAPPAV
ncbi:MAG: helix-turn-helix domain-containing protein [Armatimonadota bacterium]